MLLKFCAILFLCGRLAAQTPPKLRILAIGAHPDDCDFKFGGTAAKLARAGYAVKFLSVTNGDSGHQKDHGASLAKRRYAGSEGIGAPPRHHHTKCSTITMANCCPRSKYATRLSAAYASGRPTL